MVRKEIAYYCYKLFVVKTRNVYLISRDRK